MLFGNDALDCLRDGIPKLTRSSLKRCLECHGISRLPKEPDKLSKRGKFTETAIFYVHIDISELRLSQQLDAPIKVGAPASRPWRKLL